jgi:hypothetical protein
MIITEEEVKRLLANQLEGFKDFLDWKKCADRFTISYQVRES